MTSKDKIEILSLKSFSSLDLSELFDLKFLEIIKRADTNNIAVIVIISITTKLIDNNYFTVLLFSKINALAPSIPKVGAHNPIKMPTSLACCSLS